MAKKRDDKNTLIVNDIRVGKLYRQQYDVGDYRNAVKAAENQYTPLRHRLYSIYNDALIDGHLKAVMNKRVLNITNKTVIASVDGETVLEEITGKQWFNKLLRYIIETRFWGHSLIEGQTKGGVLADVALIPRQNVSPEKGIVMPEPYSLTNGIPFRAEPWDKALLEVGGKFDLGLFLCTTPYVLFKRNNWGDWATFTELFGMPLRVYKYNPADPDSRETTIKTAQEMGSAAYVVLPENVAVDFQQATGGTGYAAYESLREALNEELSISVLGQTMTTGDGSSRSQAEVHKEEQNELFADDLQDVESVLNEKLPEWLRYYGVEVPEGVVFKLKAEKQMPLKERIEIDTKLSELIPLSKKYLYERYGLPMPESPDDAVSGKKPLPGFL